MLSMPLLNILVVLMLSPACLAQETIFPSTTPPPSPSIATIAPAAAPSSSLPSDSPATDFCENTPGWRYYAPFYGKYYEDQYLFCDDGAVDCYSIGTIATNEVNSTDAPAYDHCCKCKVGCDDICGVANYDPYANDYDFDFGQQGPAAFVILVAGALAIACCIACIRFNQRNSRMQQELSSTRQTMSERRRQRLQSELTTTSTPTEPSARDEQILMKFYFQTVLPDNSRTPLEGISVQSLSPPKEDEENLAASQNVSQGESQSSLVILSERLSSWRKASSSEECCICLDGYHPGETICAPITDSCNHVFHQECVVEWLRNHDLCPLCRVNLME